jgi:hypothetical protein
MTILPKAIYMFNAVLIRIPMILITEIENFYLETLKTMNKQGNTELKEQCQSYHNTRLQIILQNHSDKAVWYWHKNRYEDQWNRIEDPDMKPRSYVDLILKKAPKTYNVDKRTSSTNVARKIWYLPAEN